MYFHSTCRLIQLGIIVTIILVWGSIELRSLFRNIRRKKKLTIKTFNRWLEAECNFTEWRQRNQYHNFAHPEYQWYLRQTEHRFQQFLEVKKSKNRSEERYLSELKKMIRDNIRAQTPNS